MSKLSRVGSVTDGPIYHEKCRSCDHTQAWHIEVDVNNPDCLTGKMTGCNRERCSCERWLATWNAPVR